MADPFVKLRLNDAISVRDSMPGWDNLPHGRALQSAIAAAERERAWEAKRDADWQRRKPLPQPQAHPKPSKLDRIRKAHGKRGAKARKTMEVYDAVEQRAGGVCECGCGGAFGSGLDTMPEMDHFWGRARKESVESCWMLRAKCHREKTSNKPSRDFWLIRFGRHATQHGYREQFARCSREIEAESLVSRAAEVSRG